MNMKKRYVDKKSITINVIAHCVLCISMLIISVTNLMDISLPDVAVIIIVALDALTIPAFMYASVKELDSESSQKTTTELSKGKSSK